VSEKHVLMAFYSCLHALRVAIQGPLMSAR